jgi:hypothetical protein
MVLREHHPRRRVDVPREAKLGRVIRYLSMACSNAWADKVPGSRAATSRARRPSADATRDRLVAAAGDLFSERAVEGATTRQFASRACVAHPLCTSTSARGRICRRSVDSLFDLLNEAMDERIAGLRGVDEVTSAKLRVREFITFSARTPPFRRIIMQESEVDGPRIGAMVTSGGSRTRLRTGRRGSDRSRGGGAHPEFCFLPAIAMRLCGKGCRASPSRGLTPRLPSGGRRAAHPGPHAPQGRERRLAARSGPMGSGVSSTRSRLERPKRRTRCTSPIAR